MTLPESAKESLMAFYLASMAIGEPAYPTDTDRDNNPDMGREQALSLCRYLVENRNDTGGGGSKKRRTYSSRRRRFETAANRELEDALDEAERTIEDYPDELLRLII